MLVRIPKKWRMDYAVWDLLTELLDWREEGVTLFLAHPMFVENRDFAGRWWLRRSGCWGMHTRNDLERRGMHPTWRV